MLPQGNNTPYPSYPFPGTKLPPAPAQKDEEEALLPSDTSAALIPLVPRCCFSDVFCRRSKLLLFGTVLTVLLFSFPALAIVWGGILTYDEPSYLLLLFVGLGLLAVFPLVTYRLWRHLADIYKVDCTCCAT